MAHWRHAKAGRSIPIAGGRLSEPPLPPRGIFAFSRLRRLETENGFAFFHEIETIARDRFEISHIRLEQAYFASLPREQNLLLVYLRLQIVDFGAALRQLFVGRDKQTHDHEPDRDEK